MSVLSEKLAWWAEVNARDRERRAKLSEKLAWWAVVNAIGRERRAKIRAIKNGEEYYISPNSGKVVKIKRY